LEFESQIVVIWRPPIKNSKIRLMPRSAASHIKYLLLSLLVVVAIINLTRTSLEILKSSKRLEDLKDDILTLESNKISLESEIEYKQSNEYVEEQARNALNMKKPNEKVYVNPNTLGDKTTVTEAEETENPGSTGGTTTGKPQKPSSNLSKWIALIFK